MSCLFLAALVIGVVLPASASALPRTYVNEATGNDANTCAFASPCASFQRAHTVTNAGGEINVLGPGEYGSVVITKPVTIDGNGNLATVTPAAAGVGVTVNLAGGSGGVLLRDLRINAGINAGAVGIQMVRGGLLGIDNVRILGGTQAGVRILSAQAQSNQDAVAYVNIDDTKIQRGVGTGVVVEPNGARAARVVIRDSKIDHNSGGGIRLRPTGNARARATVRDSHLDFNLNGIVVDATNGPAIANLLRTAITDSGLDGAGTGIGIFADGIFAAGTNQQMPATVRISRSEIQSNRRGLQTANGGRILSTKDNDIFGNGFDGAPTGTFGRQ